MAKQNLMCCTLERTIANNKEHLLEIKQTKEQALQETPLFNTYSLGVRVIIKS
jgi:hypothetical protein